MKTSIIIGHKMNQSKNMGIKSNHQIISFYELLKICFELDYSKQRYSVFHGFGQARFAYGRSTLGPSQFSQMSQLPLKWSLLQQLLKVT